MTSPKFTNVSITNRFLKIKIPHLKSVLVGMEALQIGTPTPPFPSSRNSISRQWLKVDIDKEKSEEKCEEKYEEKFYFPTAFLVNNYWRFDNSNILNILTHKEINLDMSLPIIRRENTTSKVQAGWDRYPYDHDTDISVTMWVDASYPIAHIENRKERWNFQVYMEYKLENNPLTL